MKNFKFLKIVLDVDRWCGIGLGVFHGSRNAFLVIFGHSKVVSEKISNFEIRLENAFSAFQAEFGL